MGMQRFVLHALCGMIRVYARVEAAMAAAQSRVPWATIVVRKMFGVFVKDMWLFNGTFRELLGQCWD